MPAIKAGQALARDPRVSIDLALTQAASAGPVFIKILAESARRAADASVARWKSGDPLSPFDGMPFAVKDNIDIAGHHTTCGSAVLLDEAPAKHDAAIVAACRALGMIPVGKTNLSEFAFSGLGINDHFGTPAIRDNSGQLRVPGGSSAGSAVAVATGIVDMAIGTDTAGSIRVPAAFTGIIGFRGSVARYDLSGIHPLAPTFDAAGSFGRTVADCVRFDAAMRGWPRPAVQSTRATALRLVVDTGALEDRSVTPAVRDNLLAAIEFYRDREAWVELRSVPTIARVRRLIVEDGWLGAAEARRQLAPMLKHARNEAIDPRIRARIETARHLDAGAIVRLTRGRAELMQTIGPELDGAILVLPTVAHSAPALGPLATDAELFARTNLATLALTMIGSFLDMPGLALPSGRDADGLSTSLLLSLPRGEDERLLAAGLAIEDGGIEGGTTR